MNSLTALTFFGGICHEKTIAIVFSLVMILSLAACGNSADQTGRSSAEGNRGEQSSTEENPAEKYHKEIHRLAVKSTENRLYRF